MALSPLDLIGQAIVNSGSTSVALVTLEVWRLASLILYGVEPGQLELKDCDDISDTLYENFGILFNRDIEEIIKELEQSKKPYTTIQIGNDD